MADQPPTPERRLSPPPASLTSFVGRDREVATAVDLLRTDDVRLVVLTGPGGVGKTRLALRVVDVLAPDFTSGVAWIDLTPVTEPELVLGTIARAAGVRESGNRPLIEQLVETLRDLPLLLVLDNVEQVVESAPVLVDILAGCPKVKALATSRVVLHVSGEYTVAVPPLDVPPSEAPSSVEAVHATPAGRLFVARAKAARSDFALTPENAPAIAEVVRRLDGLPLAIELAAARIRHLSVDALLVRLDHRLPLLTAGTRDVPVRRRTLRDAIAWSYDLLPPEEQTLFRRLAVFVGGFTLDAAEAIGDSGPGQLSSFDGVTSLVDKSLLRAETDPTGQPRYSMLETIREFGLVQLVASDEETVTRQRHVAWSLTLAEPSDPTLWAWPTRERLDQLAIELPNLRAAMTWLIETGDTERGMRLAGALYGFWIYRSHRGEGRTWLARALAARRDQSVTVAHARAVNALGVLELFLGDPGAAGHVDESLRLWRLLDDPAGIAGCLLSKGLVTQVHGDAAGAIPYLEEATVRLEGLEDRNGLAFTRLQLGHAMRDIGDEHRAEALFLDALALFQETGYGAGIASTMLPLGETAADRGDLTRAVAHIAETLTYWDELGQQEGLVDSLTMSAWLAATSGRHEPAVRLLGAARALTGALGYAPTRRDRARADLVVATTLVALGETAFAALLADGRLLSPAQATAEAQTLLSTLTFPATVVTQSESGPRPLLTSREFDVLQLLVAGRTNPEIAEALYVSTLTVRTHVTNILAKLGVSTRTEAAARAIRDGLV